MVKRATLRKNRKSTLMELISKTLKLLESSNYYNKWNRNTGLFIPLQKLLNIPETSLLRHNRKSIRAYENR